MAYNIHWKIKFRVLNSNQLLTVNIWKDGTLPSGYPLTLTGAQAPFSTQEDDNEDLFQPIRTQSGYLRIVDDGTALNSSNASVSFNWKDLLPSTDTDRPVTLTDSSNNILWQGFMQAQNFSGSLYGGTQVREFPVQCCLTVTQGKDINYSQTQIQNFAYLLKQIVDSIPNGFRPANFIIQGGTDARMWLMKKIDWQNFASLDSDGTLAARFTMYQCLEDMCRFWGWTARTQGDTMYLMCIDDQAEQSLLTLTYAQLGTLAGGTSAGSTDTISSVTPSGDIYASTEIDDFRNRGANKAVVTVDINEGDEFVLEPLNDKTVEAMKALGTQPITHGTVYTNDLLSLNQPYITLTCREGYASLNTAQYGQAHTAETNNVIRIKKTGGNNVEPFVQMETTFEHNYHDGFLRMYGNTWRFAEKYLDPYDDFPFVGRSYMYARIGIGRTRSSARWWNGRSWQSTQTYCRISIGNGPNTPDNNKEEFMFMYLQETQASADDWLCNILPVSNLQGKLFIDLLGTSNDRVEEIDGERLFDLNDFHVGFTRNPGVVKYTWASDFVEVKDITRPTTFEYKAKNGNDVREDWNADCIYASQDKMYFGYGELIDLGNTFVETVIYGLSYERPEQHLANRVVNFWATAKRMIRTDLWNSDSVVGAITPRHYVTIDGTRLHPFAISHEWRDDVVTMSLLEIPT